MIAMIENETTEMWLARKWANDGERMGAVKDARDLLRQIVERSAHCPVAMGKSGMAQQILRLGKDVE